MQLKYLNYIFFKYYTNNLFKNRACLLIKKKGNEQTYIIVGHVHQNLRWCQHFEMSPILKSMTMDSCTGEPSGFDMLMYNTSNKLSHFRKSKFVYTSVFITDNPQVLPRWFGFFFSPSLKMDTPSLYITPVAYVRWIYIYTVHRLLILNGHKCSSTKWSVQMYDREAAI